MPRPVSAVTLLRVAVGFGLLLVALLATGWLLFEQQRSAGWVAHTFLAQERIQGVMSLLQDAEAAQRGYLLTDEPAYLEPFDSDIALLSSRLEELATTVADNSRQVANFQKLRPLLDGRRDLLQSTVGQALSGNQSGALQNFREGRDKAKMTDIRAAVATMLDEESRLLRLRQKSASTQAKFATGGLLVSGALILLFGNLLIIDQRQRLRESHAARDELSKLVDLLRFEAESRRAAEAQVRQLQKMEAVGQLTGGIAHDFNNMLSVIIGSLELARRRIDGDLGRVLNLIDNATEGAKRAAQLTSRLLAFSRQQPLEPQVLDANKMVASMSELLRRTLGDHIRLETVLAGGLWPTHADPVQLENVVLNLCVNAKDAMPDGGRLTIETANTSLDDTYAAAHADVTAGQYVCVSVTDTGTGMPPEVIERAFDPFYTTKGVGRGTGLGLSQVFGFVKQSAGHVKIYSEPGHGTTVKVYLPRQFGVQAVALQPRDIVEIPRARDDEIVLVVEDDEQVRHMSTDILQELGYTVLSAADAIQAFEVLALQPRVDLMFTDIMMPGMNGRQLADSAIEKFPTLKILFTTGYTQNAIVHNGVLDPGVAFVAKPFTVPQLALKIRQVLESDNMV